MKKFVVILSSSDRRQHCGCLASLVNDSGIHIFRGQNFPTEHHNIFSMSIKVSKSEANCFYAVYSKPRGDKLLSCKRKPGRLASAFKLCKLFFDDQVERP